MDFLQNFRQVYPVWWFCPPNPALLSRVIVIGSSYLGNECARAGIRPLATCQPFGLMKGGCSDPCCTTTYLDPRTSTLLHAALLSY